MPPDADARRAIAEILNLAVLSLKEEIEDPDEIVHLIADLLASIQLAILFGRAKWVQVVETAGKLAYSLPSGEGQWRAQVAAIRPFLARSEKIAAMNLTGLHYQVLEHTRGILSDETTIHVGEIAKCGCLLAHADKQESPSKTGSGLGT